MAHRWAWSKKRYLSGRLIISLSVQQLFSIQGLSAHRESLCLPAKGLSLSYQFSLVFCLAEAERHFGMDSDRSIVIPEFLDAKVYRRTGTNFDVLRNGLRSCAWNHVLFHSTGQPLAGRNLLFWAILINLGSFLVWREVSCSCCFAWFFWFFGVFFSRIPLSNCSK